MYQQQKGSADAGQCVHCGQRIRKFVFALGEKWLHVQPDASFPSQERGTAWWHCRRSTVATPPVEERGD